MAASQTSGAAVADDEYEYHPPPAPAPKAAAGATSFRTGTGTSKPAPDDEYEYSPPKPAAAAPKPQSAEPTSTSDKLTAPIDTEAKNPISRTLSSAGGTVIGALSHPIDTLKGGLESLGDVATLGMTEGSPIGESVRTWMDPKTRPTWEGIKSVLPEALGQGIGNVALGEAAGAVAPSVVKGIGRIPDAIRDKAFTPPVPPGFRGIAAENLAEPVVRRGAEKIFRGVRPAAGDVKFREDLAKALPDLADVERAAPLGKSGTAGGIINPDMRIRQTVENIDNKLSDIWTRERQPQIDRQGDAHGMTRAQVLGDLTPEETAEIERKIRQPIPENLSIREADDLRHKVTQYLHRVDQLTPEGKAQVLETQPVLDNLNNMKGRLLNGIGEALETRGEPGIREFNRRYGALSEVRNALRTRMNPAEANRLLDQVRLRAGTGGTIGILERLHITPSPGRLVQKGLEKLGGSELRPPPTPPPPINAPRALLPPPTPVLAPNVDTSGPIRNAPPPMIWTPEMREQVARQTPQAPPNAAGQVTGIGSVQNPQALGPRGTAGTRFAPKGLLPGPIAGTPAQQVGTPPPVGFPLDTASPWQGGGIPRLSFESEPTRPITLTPPEVPSGGNPTVSKTGIPGGYHVPPLKPPKAGGAAAKGAPAKTAAPASKLTLEEVRKAIAEGQKKAPEPEAEAPKAAEPEAPPKAKEPEGVLPGMAEHVAKQKAGAAEVAGEKLTAEANTPKNVEATPGAIDKSPLFRGKGPQKEIFEPAPVSKPLAEEYTPEEIEEANLLLKQELGVARNFEKTGPRTEMNEMGDYNPQKIQSSERGVFAGGRVRWIGSGRNLLPFMKTYPEYTATKIAEALEKPNAPASQKMLERAAKMVRAEKLAKAGRLREPGEEGPAGPPGPIEGVPF